MEHGTLYNDLQSLGLIIIYEGKIIFFSVFYQERSRLMMKFML